jgi:16S rRNA G966 N2-methylase RsmD
MLNELFPIKRKSDNNDSEEFTEYDKLQFDNEGLYSITNYNEADYISKIIKSNFIETNKLSILDGTGGLGGNTFSFSKYFDNITTIELNKERFEMLKNNIKLYKFKNIELLNTDSVQYFYKNYNKFNIYFFDPPWGGPNYKTLKNISLTLGSKSLIEITNFLKENTKDKILVFKLPFNYNFLEFNEFNYKLVKINKYYIILILL